MSRTAVIAAFAAVLPVLSYAQTKPQKLEFEVASIRPMGPTEGKVDLGMHIDGSQVRFNALSVRDCIRLAWQLKDYQIVGPDWISSDRFNISAKLPEGGGTPDQIREMLQNLLQERFRLVFHHEQKEFAVYALLQGKNGIKLKETTPDPVADAAPAKGGLNVSGSGSANGVFIDLGQGSFYSFADNKLTGHKLTMLRAADILGSYMDKPVVDMTGIPDTRFYDMVLELTPDDYRVMLIRVAIRNGVSLPPQAAALAEGATDSLYTALDAAGLKVDPRKAPLDVMVIDRGDKNPTEN